MSSELELTEAGRLRLAFLISQERAEPIREGHLAVERERELAMSSQAARIAANRARQAARRERGWK